MTNPAQEQAKSGPVKRLSAKKRQRQNETRRVRNKAARSCIKTKIRLFHEELPGLESEKAQSALREIQGQLDKAAKKGLYKGNKASRLQSRLAARLRTSTTS